LIVAFVHSLGTFSTRRRVYGCLGCSPQCRRCAATIRRIMDEALGTCTAGCADGGGG
jgi:bacterioferritin-associated ferredoxin